MARLAWCFFLTLVLMGLPLTEATQTEPSDPEVAKGVRLVEEGDYDAAILTLDRAARRLATDPAETAILSQAYLYLGIAYLGKGHEAAAKAQFREAVSHIRDLTLNPAEFPPKVIDLFEAAKEEAGATTPAPAADEPEEREQTQVPSSGGGGPSRMRWILVGAGGVAGLGIISAAAKKEEDSGNGNGGPSGPVTNQFPGVLNEGHDCAEHRIQGGGGHWLAEANWSAGSAVWIGIYTEDGMELVAEGRMLSPTSANAEWDGCCNFKVELCWIHEESPIPPGEYQLRVTHPRP